VSRTTDWYAGALAEAQARDEGLSPRLRDMRDLLGDLARCHPEQDEYSALAGVTWIYSCEQPLRRRLRLARRIVFG
jgi:hypothetical protein